MDLKLTRFRNNPILTPTKHNWENRAVYNCGAALYQGRVVLLYRAQGDDMISRLGLAFSDDGYHISERLTEPVFLPDLDTEYEKLGVEDPRISQIDDSYYITYTAASLYPSLFNRGPEKRPSGEIPWRVRVSIAHTHDFRTFTRHGVVISHIDSKDATLFPEKVHDNFLLIHRVIPELRLAVADEIGHFQERGPIFGPREHEWDSNLVGAGAPPIKTPYGWVLVYHGVKNHRYMLGLALLDTHNPLRVLYRSKEPILSPQTDYEKNGLVDDVVFSCGAVVKDGELLVYYGGGDAVVGVASLPYKDLLQWAKFHYERRH